ncbi:hypothetical protein [Streptomyces sp. G-G2]|uniref:hypothetical protein n=1 Tax=Streptomyces sp. G-G2 TaxID=3046201 RepID=UPI0024B8C3ED|nr:hypothetical protein [Streptomyces sp. G-G2]MDJ0385234.1 hypothetical protein [Streptomyces sp. G-G2]
MAMRGDRITLTTDIEALGTRHQAGAQGTVEEVHTGGHLTVRMDDGSTNFPTRDGVTPASQ